MNEDKNEIAQDILNKIIRSINNIGTSVQQFQTALARLPSGAPKDEEGNISVPDSIRPEVHSLNSTEKEISHNFKFILTLLSGNFEVPEKIVNTLCVLSLKFIELINTYDSYLEQNISGEVLKQMIPFYLKQKVPKSKSKYPEYFIKLSYSLIDNDKFDLKTYLDDIFILSDALLCSEKYFSPTEKIAMMPGVVSKLVKLIMNNDFRIHSKVLNVMTKIFKVYMELVLSLYKADHLNYKNFFEFYSVFVLNLIKSYQEKAKKIHPVLFDLNILLLKNQNCHITDDLYENIFYLLNKIIFSLIDQENSISTQLIFDFYAACGAPKNYTKEKCFKSISDAIEKMKISFKRKELIRFNNSLENFCGTFFVFILNAEKSEILGLTSESEKEPELQDLILSAKDITQETTLKGVMTSLFDLLTGVIRKNERIFFEVINYYEMKDKNLTIEDCFSKVKTLFLTSVLNTYEQEIKFDILDKYLCILFSKFPEVLIFFYNKLVPRILSRIKKFNSSFNKNKLRTKKALNVAIEEMINELTLFCFVIFLPNQKVGSVNLSQIKYIIQFFISAFCDNQEQFEVNKIFSTNISLLNFYTISLCLFGYNNDLKFTKQNSNSHIILSMVNYSNKIALLKYASMILVFRLSKENNLQNFIVTNFNFIINTILNKVIYFSNSASNAKILILHFFTSLLELINKVNNENMNNFYCGEFLKYIKRLFPYIDSNITEKKFQIVSILLELLSKISKFQAEVIPKIYQDYKLTFEEKKSVEDLEKTNEVLDYLKEKLSISNSNIIRQLILRISPLILSKEIKLIGKTLNIICDYVPVLYLLPMEREEEENFSAEDPSNVLIPSSLGPVMHEIWRYIVFALGAHSYVTIAYFKAFYELFCMILKHYPGFFNHERLLGQLLPSVQKVFEGFQKKYKPEQYSDVIIEFIGNFLRRVCLINKFDAKWKNYVIDFINEFENDILKQKEESTKNKFKDEVNQINRSFSLS